MDGDFVPKRNGRKLMNIEKLIFPNEYLVSNWGECVAFTVLHFIFWSVAHRCILTKILRPASQKYNFLVFGGANVQILLFTKVQ